VLLPPGEPIIIGKPAIQQYWTRFLNAIKSHKIDFKIVEIVYQGDIIYLVTTYNEHIVAKDGQVSKDRGKWAQVWKRQSDGSWKVDVSIWNSDGTAAGSQVVMQK
jgi:ketosteroid isomerase-like protein